MDLKTSEAKGKSGDARFLKRTLTSLEHGDIRRSTNPNRLLWAFWAAKETAYKAINKLYPDISSSPGRYAVQLKAGAASARGMYSASGMVQTSKGKVLIRVLFHPDYVHCIGGYPGSGNLDDMKWGVGTIDAHFGPVSERESQSARQLAISRIAGILHRDPRDILISKQNPQSPSGWPKIFINGELADMDISLSHDGRFAAFAVAGLRN